MANTLAANRKEILGHPAGLFILFLTEMWERFSYYGMRAILVLYITAQAMGDNPGLGWTNGEALALYGWYTMLVYVASIPGGIIADRLIGQKRAVLYGGILLCIGHGILAISATWAFYTGLGFIIAGVGMLKPNISTMVGGLYAQGDDRRDVGFTIFYIGINIGAFLASIIVGVVAARYGWHYGFGLAGIVMVIGLISFVLGQRYLQGVGDFIGVEDNPNKADMHRPLTQIERDRMIVMFLSFLLIIVFWGAFEQAGGLMNLYTDQKTDTLGIPAAVFQSLNPGYIILFGVPVGWFWLRWKKMGREASSLFKMAVGLIIMGAGFLWMSKASTEVVMDGNGNIVEKSAVIWLFLAYLFHTIGELCASPVALSFITKLAPVKYASFMMGAYFAATGIGNKLAGSLGELSEFAGEFQVFTGIAVFCIVFGLIVIAMLKPLKRLTHGAEDLVADTQH